MTETDVLQKLDAIRDEADQIYKLFEKGHLPSVKVPEAQERFRSLKEKIHAEYKRMATGRGQKALSKAEAQYYKPAIDDAWANTLSGSGACWNSNPDHGWQDVLWNISDYMATWIGRLRASHKG